jgi:membrane associated rhomboid family serine protease
MLPFPYKADVNLGRVPIMTLIVCALCIWVFAEQEISAHAYRSALKQYCNYDLSRDERLVRKYLFIPVEQHYCEVLLNIRAAPDRNAAIRKLADASLPTPFYRNASDSSDYVYNTLLESSRRFERAIPSNLTEDLAYEPGKLNLWRMLTSSFSHADWWHVISNLIFFFAFAACVEVIAGYVFFFGFILISAVGTNLAYSYSVAGVEGALPTVGLSGVVMAMMAFLATVAPFLRIKCFFWFIVFIRIFRVPALAIAALYVVENVFDYMNRDPESNINYIAHISGAALGVAAGLIYRFTHREFLREMVHDI